MENNIRVMNNAAEHTSSVSDASLPKKIASVGRRERNLTMKSKVKSAVESEQLLFEEQKQQKRSNSPNEASMDNKREELLLPGPKLTLTRYNSNEDKSMTFGK